MSNRFLEKTDRLGFSLLMALMAECTLGSSGRWLAIGGVSIRMLLFALCFVATLPALCSRLRQTMRRPHVALAILFGMDLAAMAVVGWRHGNALAFVKADVTSFLTLALLPGFLATVNTKKRVERLMDCLFVSACALALVTAITHYALAFLTDEQTAALSEWLTSTSMGGLFTLTTGVQRVYFKSQMFLQVAILLGAYKITRSSVRVRTALYLCEGLLLFACILSYTRGFWLGLAISACLLLVFDAREIGTYLKALGAGAVVFCALMLVSWAAYGAPKAAVEVVHRFDPNLIVLSADLGEKDRTPDSPKQSPAPSGQETISKENRIAVELREQSLRGAYAEIARHPLLGAGLGKNLDDIRADGKIEYTYLDVLMKMGAVGLVLFLLTFFWPVIEYLIAWARGLKKWIDAPERLLLATMTAGYLGVAITSAVNPFLTNPMGIMLLMLLSAAMQCYLKKEAR